ncbi:MAG: hypothetical protein ACI4KR_08250 [Ruminiclostridium sp.]
MTKVTIKNYKDATYKTTLTLTERGEIIKAAVELSRTLFENEVYGATQYAIFNAIVSGCTNLNLDGATPDEKWVFYTKSDVLEVVKNALSEDVFNSLFKEFDIAMKYIVSGNNEVRRLLSSILAITETPDNSEGDTSGDESK